jgi:dTDP-glucose pyrophosphorylase
MHKAWKYPKEKVEETRKKMQNKPVLVVMAAGMGSRYGGMKQIDPVGSNSEIIIDFSLYDAIRAGFEDAIFIIKKEHEQAFREILDKKAGRYMNIQYAFQELEDLPNGYSVPEGREKPWGTCHAVMAARKLIQGPFCCINADDFYGASAFAQIYNYLCEAKDDSLERFSMVGYYLENTITENGSVARGVCVTQKDGDREFLTKLDERLKIEKRENSIAYTEDDETWIDIPKGSVVSMNFWGFTESFMDEMVKGFPAFLDEAQKTNPLKAEYLLPRRVDELINEKKASVEILKSEDKWFGVTYKEDKKMVVDSIQALKDAGVYPDDLCN